MTFPSVTAREIVGFLEKNQLLAVPVSSTQGGLNARVTGIARDADAEEGALSWIAKRRATELPGIAQSFKGALLICPEAASELPIGKAVIASCSNPKVAFSLVVERFFPELLSIEWPTAGISPDAQLGKRIRLAPGVCLGQDVTLGDDVSVGPNTCLANVVVGARSSIGANCSIGLPGFGYEKAPNGSYVRFPHVGRVIIAEDVTIGSNSCIDRGALGDTRIERGVKIDNLVHIAHNVTIGADSLIIAHAMLGGSVSIAEDVWVAPSVAIKNQLDIGAGAVLGMGAVVIRDVAEGSTVVGNPAKELHR